MRTLSFENLRRLVGRRKDRDEPSFERSESFKRISIRKSYLDRGKRRTRLQKANDDSDSNATTPVVKIEVSSAVNTKNVVGPTIIQVRGDGNISEDFDLDEKKEKRISREDVEVNEINEEFEYDDEEENDDDDDDDDDDEQKLKREETPSGTIVYGQWLNDVDSSFSSKEKNSRIDSYSSRDSEYNLALSKDKINIFKEKHVINKRHTPLPHAQKVNVNEDNKKGSSILVELNKSPHFRRSQLKIQQKDEKQSVKKTDDFKNRNVSNGHQSGHVITVNVRSNEFEDTVIVPSKATYAPTCSKQNVVESNADDKRNEHVALTKASPTSNKQLLNKTDTSSTRTSAFSLSLSFSRLTTDIRSAALSTKNGLFRRRKRGAPMKPAPSVSAEGYFERTAAAASSGRKSRRSTVGSGRRRSTYASRRRKITTSKPSSVVDNPVWFVPPERRRSNRQCGRVWREVRCLPQDDGKVDGDKVDNRNNNWSNDSNLSDEFDDKKLLLSGDFEEKSEVSLSSRKIDSASTLDSSSLLSSETSLVSLKPKISDFNEDKIFYEEYRGEKSKPTNSKKGNFFASSQFIGYVSKKTVDNGIHNLRCQCTSSSESELEKQQRVLLVVGGNKKVARNALNLNVSRAKVTNERKNCSVVLVVEEQKPCNASRQQEVGPGQRRRPLRRRSQLKRGAAIGVNNVRAQPVYLARRRSSLRRRPCSKNHFNK